MRGVPPRARRAAPSAASEADAVGAREAGPSGSWIERTRSLHAELASLAAPERWWWLVAGGVAAAEVMPGAARAAYLACDAEPDADALIGYRARRPADPIGEAIARARAARVAVRELDGALPGQPLAVTLARTGGPAVARALGTRLAPSSLDVAAFAIGSRVITARLDDPELEARLRAPGGGSSASGVPFVCVAIGDEPLATARHGHRRAWTGRGGPWLGLGRAGDLAIVSTCHLVVDGYGHARLAARIAEQVAATEPREGPSVSLPPLPAVAGAVPLSIAWRDLEPPLPRVIPLAYRLGCILHRRHGRAAAAFSPTVQIPVALGRKDDPHRLRRRVVASAINVRIDARGDAEPFDVFEARVRAVFAREAASRGLVSRLLAAARALPAPIGWKRRGIGAKRPAWLEGFAEVVGGRALLSQISVDAPIPRSYAVSSPSRLASALDSVGSCVLSMVDDGTRGTITLSGSGQLASEGLLDELLDGRLAVVPPATLR